jgi:hypothetical protein
MRLAKALSQSHAPVEFTGHTLQGDELIEWCDEEEMVPTMSQHAVAIYREWRGLPDIAFHFGMQSEAHALFMALCQAEKIIVEGENK